MLPISLYLHWPFCNSKCSYCGFNSYANITGTIDYNLWCNAYIKAINSYADILAKRQLKTIFFGGGTPSLMPANVIKKILSAIADITNYSNYSDNNSIEITLEANPENLSLDKIKQIKDCGINRLSIGIQSLKESSLLFLGRKHSAESAKLAIKNAGRVFSNFSIDLIYALPNQLAHEWKQELNDVIEIGLDNGIKHLSLYQLTVDDGTKLQCMVNNNLIQMLSSEKAAVLYEITQEITEQYCINAYEVSNHAITGYECKHNINYWTYKDYIGIGPGAHSRITNTANFKYGVIDYYRPNIWLEQVHKYNNGISNVEILHKDSIIIEKLLMGLRMIKGIRKSELPNALHNANMKKLINANLIEEKDYSIKCTPKGLLLLDTILQHLL